MSAYRILVVDDRFEKCRNLYEKLLSGVKEFEWSGTGDPQEFENTRFSQFDAVILDINLHTGGWRHSLKESLNIVGSACPIILASAEWDTERTLSEVARVLADRGDIQIVQSIALAAIKNTRSDEYIQNIRQQMILALSQFHQRASLMVSPEETINILHTSDPQFGDPDHEAFMPEAEIGQYLESLGEDIHFITITGDISYSGLPAEFDSAIEAIDDLQSFVWGGTGVRERILLVPGNHDVNLRLMAADCFGYNFKERGYDSLDVKLSQHLKYGLQPFRDFAYEVTKDRRWRESVELCWTNESFLHLGLRFYHLNSVYSISSLDASAAEVPVQALKKILRDRPWGDSSVFGIALSHHGPIDAADPTAKYLANWDNVKHTIKNSDINMFIHGHGHRRMAQLLDSWPQTENVIRVMAPSTHLGKTKRPADERRGFNIIKLYRREGVVRKVHVIPVCLQDGAPTPARDDPYVFDAIKE